MQFQMALLEGGVKPLQGPTYWLRIYTNVFIQMSSQISGFQRKFKKYFRKM